MLSEWDEGDEGDDIPLLSFALGRSLHRVIWLTLSSSNSYIVRHGYVQAGLPYIIRRHELGFAVASALSILHPLDNSEADHNGSRMILC